MTVFESIMLFLTVALVFLCIGVLEKDVSNLKHKMSVILDVMNDCLGLIDNDFDIHRTEINSLRGPTYGPMLEDDE